MTPRLPPGGLDMTTLTHREVLWIKLKLGLGRVSRISLIHHGISMAASRRHSSLNRRSMPRPEKNVARGVHVAVMDRSALAATPFSYSKTCDTSRPLRRKTSARRTGLGSQSLAHLFVHRPVRNRFVTELVPQGGPACIVNRLRHAGFGEAGGVHIPDRDVVEVTNEPRGKLVKKIAPCVLDACVDVCGKPLLPCALSFAELGLQASELARIVDNLASAEGRQSFEAQVDSDRALNLSRRDRLNIDSEVQIPAAPRVLTEAGAVAELGAGRQVAGFEDAERLSHEPEAVVGPADRWGPEWNPSERFLSSVAQPRAAMLMAAADILMSDHANRGRVKTKFFAASGKKLVEVIPAWPTLSPLRRMALHIVAVVPNVIHRAGLAVEFALERLHAIAVGQDHLYQHTAFAFVQVKGIGA